MVVYLGSLQNTTEIILDQNAMNYCVNCCRPERKKYGSRNGKSPTSIKQRKAHTTSYFIVNSKTTCLLRPILTFFYNLINMIPQSEFYDHDEQWRI